jgi:hypothetical protein
MKGAEGDTKQALDQGGHTPLGPTIGGKAMGSSTLFEGIQETVSLLRSQTGWPTGDGTRRNARLASAAIAALPPIDGISIHAEKFGDLGWRLAGL